MEILIYPCSQGHGIPNAQFSVSGNICLLMPSYFLFIMNPPSGPASPGETPAMPGFIRNAVLMILYPLRLPIGNESGIVPRWNTFLAVFVFSSMQLLQIVHKNMPSLRSPMAPQQLHSLPISFPITSTSSTAFSLHFCSSRLRIYPRFHIDAEWLILRLMPAVCVPGSFAIYIIPGFSVCRKRFISWLI